MKEETSIIPCDITPIDTELLGKMHCCQRRLYMLIVERSALGLYTTYQHARDNGVAAPEKRMQELLKIKGTDIKRVKNKRPNEWYV